MLNVLTKYLLQYRTVSIPHVGTFDIVQRPAEINFIDKVLLPPTWSTEFREEQNISDHQLNYLAAVTKADRQSASNELYALGKKLSEELEKKGFSWNGIGVVNRQPGSMPFTITTLQPIDAIKVLRSDADHRVLVGEKETSSHEIAESAHEPHKRQRQVSVIIGWTILALAVSAICYLLYKGDFSVYSSGLKSNP